MSTAYDIVDLQSDLLSIPYDATNWTVYIVIAAMYVVTIFGAVLQHYWTGSGFEHKWVVYVVIWIFVLPRVICCVTNLLRTHSKEEDISMMDYSSVGSRRNSRY